MRTNKSKTLGVKLDRIFYKYWLVIVIVLIATFIPAFLYRNAIHFDKAIFVTEWTKASAETILLVLLLKTLSVWRDSRLEKKADEDYIEENLTFFTQMALDKLRLIKCDTIHDNREILGPHLQFCVTEIISFFEHKKYTVINDRPTRNNYYEIHLEMIQHGSLILLSQYFELYRILSPDKCILSATLLKKIDSVKRIT